MSVHHWINEGLMAVFFFAVGLEIKREFTSGALKSLQQAALPCIGALGGMLVPMAVYLMCNNAAIAGASAVVSGWAIPMATDIAFAMGVYNFFKNKMPSGVAAFLLTLATVDDLGAIAVIAVCFAKNLAMSYIAGAALTCVALFAACKRNVTNMGVYAGLGVTLWYCLLQGGINADVAGVIAAFAVPASAPAPKGSTAPPEHDGGEVTLIDHLVHTFAPLSALFIMPAFALANTAVPLDASMISGVFTEPVGRGIMLGLLLGKPIGIAGLSWLAVKAKLGKLPTGMTNNHLITVGALGGIGFTMCLFLVECCFANNPAAANVGKLSVLMSSTFAAMLGAAMMARMPDPKVKLA
jgi:NhaA family Na+:H+ antiporter